LALVPLNWFVGHPHEWDFRNLGTPIPSHSEPTTRLRASSIKIALRPRAPVQTSVSRTYWKCQRAGAVNLQGELKLAGHQAEHRTTLYRRRHLGLFAFKNTPTRRPEICPDLIHPLGGLADSRLSFYPSHAGSKAPHSGPTHRVLQVVKAKEDRRFGSIVLQLGAVVSNGLRTRISISPRVRSKRLFVELAAEAVRLRLGQINMLGRIASGSLGRPGYWRPLPNSFVMTVTDWSERTLLQPTSD